MVVGSKGLFSHFRRSRQLHAQQDPNDGGAIPIGCVQEQNLLLLCGFFRLWEEGGRVGQGSAEADRGRHLVEWKLILVRPTLLNAYNLHSKKPDKLKGHLSLKSKNQ